MYKIYVWTGIAWIYRETKDNQQAATVCAKYYRLAHDWSTKITVNERSEHEELETVLES